MGFLHILVGQTPRTAGEDDPGFWVALGQPRHRQQPLDAGADGDLSAGLGHNGIDHPAEDDNAVDPGQRFADGRKPVLEKTVKPTANRNNGKQHTGDGDHGDQPASPTPPPGPQQP